LGRMARELLEKDRRRPQSVGLPIDIPLRQADAIQSYSAS
jgi:hypothetical protein